MDKKQSFFKRFPLLFGVIGFAIAICGIMIPDLEGYIPLGILRFVLSAVIILVTWPSLSSELLKFPGSGWKSSFKLWKWVLIISGVVALLSSVGTIIASMMPNPETGEAMMQLNPNWLKDLLTLLFFLISVGIFEEVTFRRSLFYAGIKQFPNMKCKAMWMAVITSVIFGFVHVVGDLSFDSVALVGIVVKTIQAGAFGFIMCAALIEGQNIWPLALIHMLADLSLSLTAVFQGKEQGNSYVFNSSSGGSVMAYIPMVVITILYIAPFIKSVKILKAYDQAIG